MAGALALVASIVCQGDVVSADGIPTGPVPQSSVGFKVEGTIVSVQAVAYSPALISPIQSVAYGDDGNGGPIMPILPPPATLGPGSYGPGAPSAAAALNPDSLSNYDPVGGYVPTGPNPLPGIYPPRSLGVGISCNYG